MPKSRPLLNQIADALQEVYFDFEHLIKWSIALAILYYGIDAAETINQIVYYP